MASVSFKRPSVDPRHRSSLEEAEDALRPIGRLNRVTICSGVRGKGRPLVGSSWVAVDPPAKSCKLVGGLVENPT